MALMLHMHTHTYTFKFQISGLALGVFSIIGCKYCIYIYNLQLFTSSSGWYAVSAEAAYI